MKNYFIIHGSFGSPFGNWFPWLYEKIEESKPKNMEEPICYVPEFPTGVGFQNYENWEKLLLFYAKTGKFNKKSTIFAHSIAPIFICKFLIKNKIKVKRLVFVCGFNDYVIPGADDYNKVNESMFCKNFADVKKYCDDIVCFYSNNDPYVPFAKEKEFADAIANESFVIQGGGHLNKSAGFDKFDELKKYIG